MKRKQVDMETFILWILPIIAGAVICGFVSCSSRGSDTGFLWGFFLGPLGILIAALKGIQDRLDSPNKKEPPERTDDP